MKNIVNFNLSTSRRVLAFIPHFSPYHTTTKHPSTIHHQSIHHPTNKPSPLLLPPSTLPNPLLNSSIDAIIPAAVDLRDFGLQAELYDDVLSVGVRDLPREPESEPESEPEPEPEPEAAPELPENHYHTAINNLLVTKSVYVREIAPR